MNQPTSLPVSRTLSLELFSSLNSVGLTVEALLSGLCSQEDYNPLCNCKNMNTGSSILSKISNGNCVIHKQF